MVSELVLRLGEPLTGIEEGFAGNTPNVETGTAKRWRFLYTSGAETEL
jgi:hypothetical protein